jgi:hypothetical protein
VLVTFVKSPSGIQSDQALHSCGLSMDGQTLLAWFVALLSSSAYIALIDALLLLGHSAGSSDCVVSLALSDCG